MATVLVKLLQDTMFDKCPLVKGAKHSVDESTAQRWEDNGIAEICTKGGGDTVEMDVVDDAKYAKQLESKRISELRQECTKYGIKQSNTDTKAVLISKLLNKRI